jgi:hypothetical protein
VFFDMSFFNVLYKDRTDKTITNLFGTREIGWVEK